MTAGKPTNKANRFINVGNLMHFGQIGLNECLGRLRELEESALRLSPADSEISTKF